MPEHKGKWGYYPVRETLWVYKWSCCFSEDRDSKVCDYRTQGYRPYHKVHTWDRAKDVSWREEDGTLVRGKGGYTVDEWEKRKAEE